MTKEKKIGMTKEEKINASAEKDKFADEALTEDKLDNVAGGTEELEETEYLSFTVGK